MCYLLTRVCGETGLERYYVGLLHHSRCGQRFSGEFSLTCVSRLGNASRVLGVLIIERWRGGGCGGDGQSEGLVGEGSE